jgi:lysophospholipid acyltransferase (LPLAT)-like uncharacterized protein
VNPLESGVAPLSAVLGAGGMTGRGGRGQSPLALAVAARAAALLLRLLGASWRVTTEGPDPLPEGRAPHLAAFWHRNILTAVWYYRDRGFGTAVSRSRDGDLITALLGALGYRAPARGSSSRGGAAALLRLVRMLRSGVTISLQTDGPRGPAAISKPGVVALARLTGVAITPVAFSARPCLHFRSWDRTLLPLPFARVVCRYGPPIEVPASADEELEETLRQRLDRELETLAGAGDRAFKLALLRRRARPPR